MSRPIAVARESEAEGRSRVDARYALRSPKERSMPYRIAGIDVHKKMLAVVLTDVEVDGDFHFERRKVGTTPADLRGLAGSRAFGSRLS
jgi:hypothetical protein